MTLEIALNAANAVLPAASEGGEESGNMLLPETSDLVWGTVAFVIIAVVLLRYALPRFTKVLDERTRRIEEGLELADKAKEDQSNAELKAARLVEDARRDAAKIREDAQVQAQEIVAAAREAAQGEAGKALDAAQRPIQADKQAAPIRLRTDVRLPASPLAGKTVGPQPQEVPVAAQHPAGAGLRLLDQHPVQRPGRPLLATSGPAGEEPLLLEEGDGVGDGRNPYDPAPFLLRPLHPPECLGELRPAVVEHQGRGWIHSAGQVGHHGGVLAPGEGHPCPRMVGHPRLDGLHRLLDQAAQIHHPSPT